MGWTRFRKKRDMPEGLWVKCPECSATLFNKDLAEALNVCGECGYHLRLPSRDRITSLLDPWSFEEHWEDLRTLDRLSFVDRDPYPVKLERAAEKAGVSEAAVAGTGTIEGNPLSLCCLDFGFMGGSMGTVVGEKVARTVELATAEGMPVVIVSCSGGARMHEGALSLMQMGKTSAALARHHAQGQLFISVLANPTTGGVMASFAALGDVILAEPKALIGFAGPRVIQETLRTELPEGFQTSEFLLEKGFIDRIVARSSMREVIGRLIRFLARYEDGHRERYRERTEKRRREEEAAMAAAAPREDQEGAGEEAAEAPSGEAGQQDQGGT